MEISPINKLKEFYSDIDDLYKAGSSTQNEIWANQLKPILYSLNISDSDLKDFERVYGLMRYSQTTNDYSNMKMFLKLIIRKNPVYKKSDLDNILKSVRPIQVNPTKRVQSSKGYPSVIFNEPTTKSISDIIKNQVTDKITPDSNKIFIVHGSDNESKLELENLVRDVGLDPIILHKQANKGKTLIEKFEEYAGIVRFAFVLFTPDDVGGKDETHLKPRARQNAILEFGYFLGKLGRNRVCCIYKEDTEIPSDMDGLVYIKFSKSPEDRYRQITKELQAAGYELKLS